ncbi:MAG: hypothetical protein AAB883_01675 [Patescibacteria group bacterium]
MRLPRLLIALSIIASLPLAACGTVDPYGYNYSPYSTARQTYNAPEVVAIFPDPVSCANAEPSRASLDYTWACFPIGMSGRTKGVLVNNHVDGYRSGSYRQYDNGYGYRHQSSGSGVAVGVIAGAAIACAIACGGGNHGHRGGHRGH